MITMSCAKDAVGTDVWILLVTEINGSCLMTNISSFSSPSHKHSSCIMHPRNQSSLTWTCHLVLALPSGFYLISLVS